MDRAVVFSFSALSVGALVANRMVAAGARPKKNAEKTDDREYLSLRNRFFAAYFLAVFGEFE
jgi:hypothetical protein